MFKDEPTFSLLWNLFKDEPTFSLLWNLHLKFSILSSFSSFLSLCLCTNICLADTKLGILRIMRGDEETLGMGNRKMEYK